MMPPECIVHMLLRACSFRFAGRADQVGWARSFLAEFLGVEGWVRVEEDQGSSWGGRP
jgi:hypothetical protein